MQFIMVVCVRPLSDVCLRVSCAAACVRVCCVLPVCLHAAAYVGTAAVALCAQEHRFVYGAGGLPKWRDQSGAGSTRPTTAAETSPLQAPNDQQQQQQQRPRTEAESNQLQSSGGHGRCTE
jgi:hypothetical protein